MCSLHEQLLRVIGVGAQWATTNIRQKATVVCEVRVSRPLACVLCSLKSNAFQWAENLKIIYRFLWGIPAFHITRGLSGP